jgi:hypothetical protein
MASFPFCTDHREGSNWSSAGTGGRTVAGCVRLLSNVQRPGSLASLVIIPEIGELGIKKRLEFGSEFCGKLGTVWVSGAWMQTSMYCLSDGGALTLSACDAILLPSGQNGS